MKKYEIDMCNGPIFSKIVSFAIPLMLSNMLQLFFNAADVMVVGRFAGATALAAVGSTTALINLLINIFVGFSVGVNVLAARYFGTGNKKMIEELVHTALPFSFLCGVVLIFVGLFLSRPLLSLMGTPDDVIDQAVLYIKIYFAGMPVTLLYNFGNAIFRAVGDTKRPLFYLAIAGVLNVVLNIFFVIRLNMGVAGVALATVSSQVLSAALLIRAFVKTDSMYKLDIKKLAIKKSQLSQIVSIGLPAGIQSSLFSLSNVIIQSSINLFGAFAMAGSTAAANVENFTYMAMNSIHLTALSFVSQNYGAGKTARIKRVVFLCLASVFVIGFVMGTASVICGEGLLGIFAKDSKVIEYGMIKLRLVGGLYFLAGIMDVLVGCIRGLGATVMPTVVSLAGVCGFRILWILTVFEWSKTLQTLYLSYSVSWVITALCHAICLIIIYNKIKKRGLGSQTM